MNQIQQVLFSRIWANHTVKKQEIKDFMIVKGKIVNIVRLNDINKNISHNQTVRLTETEVAKSKDLQNAIRRNWVEVIQDRGTIKAQIPEEKKNDQVFKTSNMQHEEILDIARKMASTMAQEMIKDNVLVKEMAKQLAKEMVAEIKDNLKVEQHVVLQSAQAEQTVPIQTQVNDVFIDFGNDEVKNEMYIGSLGKVEEKQEGLTNSLEKIRRFKSK